MKNYIKTFAVYFIFATSFVAIPFSSEAFSFGKKEQLSNDTDYLKVPFYHNDTEVTLESFKGNVVLLEFWATWCKYCERQMPAVSVLADKHKDTPNFKIVPVSIDFKGKDAVKNFFKTKGFDNLEVYTDQDMLLAKAFNARSIPRFYLFSKSGELIQFFAGLEQLDHDLLEEHLNKEYKIEDAKNNAEKK